MSIKLEDGRKLKPLVWEAEGDWLIARTPFHKYWIGKVGGVWRALAGVSFRFRQSKEEAIALCEADYARRVDELYEEIE